MIANRPIDGGESLVSDVGFKSERVLVIDDDPGMLTIVKGLLGGTTEVFSVGSLEAARLELRSRRYDVILLDHLLPDGLGLDEIAGLIASDRYRPILYVTAMLQSETAIEAIKRGAFDYLSKPVDFAHLRQRLKEALEFCRMSRQPVLGLPPVSLKNDRMEIVGRSRAMQDVYKGIGRLSGLTAPVLLEGEMGTGKETIARAIHFHSGRHGSDFHKWDLSSKDGPSDLSRWLQQQIESNQVSTQSVFLDEIGNLSSSLQSELYSFLLSNERESEVKSRVYLSTTIPSKNLVEEGRIRSDLYYLLSPYVVRVPALRDRIEDLELLVAYFMEKLIHVSSINQNQGPARVSPAAMELLRSYDWPGNVAQLKSILQSVLLESRGVVLATEELRRALGHRPGSKNHPQEAMQRSVEEIRAFDLQVFIENRVQQGSENLYADCVEKLEQILLPAILERTRSNQAKAARILGMTRTSLRRKLSAIGVQVSASLQSLRRDPNDEQD